jgi:hypothetical protein
MKEDNRLRGYSSRAGDLFDVLQWEFSAKHSAYSKRKWICTISSRGMSKLSGDEKKM